MPCRVEDPEERNPQEERDYYSDREKRFEKEAKAEREKVEAMLCSACRSLQRLGYDFDENPRVSEWWDAHKKQDALNEKKATAARLRKEQAQEIAKKPFNTLSKEDKAILKAEGYI